MLKINMEAVAAIITEVAETVIMPHYKDLHVGDIKFKSEDNPVTIADWEAEKRLSARLLDLIPGSLVLGEEGFARNPSLLDQFESDSPVWIIDPVDGTKAYISEQPYFGVIVALAKQNQTIAGWLYDPSSKEFIMAEAGGGAWHKGQKLSVKEPPDDLESLTGVFNNNFAERLMQSVPLNAPIPRILRALSSCHDHARLVVQSPHFSRKAEPIHFHGTCRTCTPWDIAAGELIHRESGGYTRHWDGSPFAPSHMGRGFLSTPDADSWNKIRNWVSLHERL